MSRSILLTGLLAIAVAGSALAQDHPEHPKKKAAATTTAAADAIEATVEGENFCVGCSLKKGEGATSQCSKYGHRHALRVTAATAAGKDLSQMKGWVLHYLDTDSAQPVIKEHHGETLSIAGKVYPEERVLEVGKLAETKKPEHPEHPE